jgi:hypothetical protein
MKPQELRIGNLLMDSLSKAELKVIELTESAIVTSVIDRKLYPLPSGWKATQIPLTEDELVKFGFRKDLNDFYLDINTVLFVSYNDEFVHLKSNNLETITSIKYVHQLQNLYFDLTGEELNYQKP